MTAFGEIPPSCEAKIDGPAWLAAIGPPIDACNGGMFASSPLVGDTSLSLTADFPGIDRCPVHLAFGDDHRVTPGVRPVAVAGERELGPRLHAEQAPWRR